MKIYFATWDRKKGQNEVLSKCGGDNRLLSYHLYSAKSRGATPIFNKKRKIFNQPKKEY